MIPATVSKINRGIFGTGVTGSSTGELLGKVKKSSMKDLSNSKENNINNKSKNGENNSKKEKDNDDTDEDLDENENSEKNNQTGDPGLLIPESKPLSLFSNLFSNKKKTENSDTKNQSDNKTKIPKSKYAENDDNNSDNEKNPVAKRKYTQFGYFAHRPSCTADSDFLTVIVSGLEVHDLFYVDRLLSPQPYLELTVGTYVRAFIRKLNTSTIFNHPS